MALLLYHKYISQDLIHIASVERVRKYERSLEY